MISLVGSSVGAREFEQGASDGDGGDGKRERERERERKRERQINNMRGV